MSERREPVPRTAVDLYTTCPAWGPEIEDYRARVAEVARWSEEAGAAGILVGADNRRLPDPWWLAQLVVASTLELAPVVALPPGDRHPAAVARRVASFVALHRRRLHLELSGEGEDGDPERLTAFARRLGQALDEEPSLPAALRPRILVVGAAAARAACGRAVDGGAAATALLAVLRAGVVARPAAAAAWEVAHARFAEGARDRLTHRAAMAGSEAAWCRDLAARAAEAADSPYWLAPFESGAAGCPYLVGSYERVGAEIARYAALGYDGLLLDVPFDRAELAHGRRALEAREAMRMAS